jgi:hypothetical protein
VSPENVLVPHCTHRLIIDVQPSFTTTVATAPGVAITVRVEYVERIVSTARGHTVVVEDTIERVARGLSGSSGGRGHDVYTSRTTIFSASIEKKKKKHVPSGISSSGVNWTDFPILTTPRAVVS